MKYVDFLDDDEKMYDFANLTKEEFLASYSYLTEKEYDLTATALLTHATDKMRTYVRVCSDKNVPDYVKKQCHKELFDFSMYYEGWWGDFKVRYKDRFEESFKWFNE